MVSEVISKSDHRPSGSVTLATHLVAGVTGGRGGVTAAGLAATRQEGLPVAVCTHVTVGSVEVRAAETPAGHGVASVRKGPVLRAEAFWTEGPTHIRTPGHPTRLRDARLSGQLTGAAPGVGGAQAKVASLTVVTARTFHVHLTLTRARGVIAAAADRPFSAAKTT